jgi:hypothetical protein
MIPWISLVFVVFSPFAFLILLIWVFLSPDFSQICQRSANLVYFFKEPAFCFVDSLYSFFFFFCVFLFILGGCFFFQITRFFFGFFFLKFFFFFLVSISLISALIFYYFSPSACFGFSLFLFF